MNARSSMQLPRTARRASRCQADPACVWPVAAAGLCVHHYRMFYEPEAASGALPGSIGRPEPAPPQVLVPAATAAMLPPEALALLRNWSASERPPRARQVHYCPNQNCGAPLGPNNRSGVCKRCADRLRSFKVRRTDRGTGRQLSLAQDLAARQVLPM